MLASSSGRIVKTPKGKRGTLHHKNHRWESFTSKIAKLNSLDPLRRVRRHALDAEDVEATTSYFNNGLKKWQELNVSGLFLEFTREVVPLCDSLPQIIHFEDRIMGLLATYLQINDRESIEPLLELLTDFAHDMGTRFEKHYARALELVIRIASKSQDVEVVEWSFGCLAFMFKYLSKLLLLDLRPTFDLLAPLLGKERQKPYTTRFAAEAMSFLIKKAAAPAVREKALNKIVHHAKVDLLSTQSSRSYGLYFHGVMTMFAEAMKGNGLSVHSSATAIIESLFASFDANELTENRGYPWADVICGVLTSLVHHSSSQTLGDIVVTVLEQSRDASKGFQGTQTMQSFQCLVLSARTIRIIAGVRKGSRVIEWSALVKALSEILECLSCKGREILNFGKNPRLWDSVVLTTAVVIQYSPMDTLIPFVSSYMGALTKDPLARWFLVFCLYFAQVDIERFRSIVLPYFQRFIVAHWSDADNEDSLCILIPNLTSYGALNSSNNSKDCFSLPQSWQDQIVSNFERLEVSPFPEQASDVLDDKSPKLWHDRCLPKYRALLELLDCSKVHPSTNARIAEILLRKLKLALRPSSTLAPDEAHFIVGCGLSAYCKMAAGAGHIDHSLGHLLRAAAPRYCRLPSFLAAMISFENTLTIVSAPRTGLSKGSSEISNWATNENGGIDVFIASLVDNICTESHGLRLLSLKTIDNWFTKSSGLSSEVLTTMLLIEELPLDLETSRMASMHIRKLAASYRHHLSDPILSKVIPAFCFGMLTVNFAQIWVDAIAALAQIADTGTGEEIVAEIAFKWLQMRSKIGDGAAHNVEKPRNDGLTDFECSNLLKVDDMATNIEQELRNSQGKMLQKFEQEAQIIPAQPLTGRTQALKVLTEVPHIAERRSRQLVPLFLSWAKHEESCFSTDDREDTGISHDWTRRDQKAQLELLAMFTNPKVLFRSTDVFSALLILLANGDVEIQKPALKAIFTWKSPSIKPYEEALLNLLDEARFKEQITLLMHGEASIEPQHRPELMRILLRLLYGRTIARKSAASGKQGMEARRLTVLRNLSVEDIGHLLDIAIGPLRHVEITEDNKIRESLFSQEILTVRKQVGFINMMQDVLKELGTNVAPFTPRLLPAILYCLVSAARELRRTARVGSEEELAASQTSMLKAVRQNGYKCLVLLFTNDVVFDWSPFLEIILEELINPRLENLPIETAQGVSGVLQLLSTWSTLPRTVLILGKSQQILVKISACLVVPKAKDDVKMFCLRIITNIIHIALDDSPDNINLISEIKKSLLDMYMDVFLIDIGNVLRFQQDPSKDLLESCVETISKLGQFVSKSTQAHNLVDISVFLLNQPARRINPKTKSGLLQILEQFVPLYNLQDDPVLKDKVYNTVTSLFGFFRDKASRETLSRLLLVYSRTDTVTSEVAALCTDLNSFVDGRLDEPDYDRRLQAYAAILKGRETPFTACQWRPLLYNMLFYIRHEEEFGILSSNSSDGICCFLERAKEAMDDGKGEHEFQSMLSSVVLPALYSGVREQSEIVRREYLKVMAHVVRTFPDWTEVNDMRSLLGGDDELELSFFNNILTAGKGRQSSALLHLSKIAERGELSSRSVGHFFIPLIEHFIFDRADGSDAHNLAAEATTTLGLLVSSLEWQQYRALLRRFIGYISSKPELEKHIIKLLGKVIDTLSLATEKKTSQYQENASEQNTERTDINPIENTPREQPIPALVLTLPIQDKFTEDLTTNILPPLIAYLHHKDDSTVSLRVPVAVIVVRLLKLLPWEKMMEKLPSVLTDICHILRSKAQESRDMTRDTLIKICVLLGPTCFGFVLKELRGALTRGYQLHVLSYTMHSILIATTPEYSPGDLDYCLPTIVAIIMDDIFGVTGQEKDAEEYVSKMKEVKSSKSHDSMELIAKTATLSRLTDLIRPIQVLLKEKLNLRMVRKIDELLSRINNGLLKNPAADSRESLIFCYEVIQDVYNTNQPPIKDREDYRLKRYLVQRGANRSGSRGSTTVYTHKLVRFAFDIMRSVLKKNDSLRTAANIAGFIPILGDALVQAEDEVKVSAFRLLTTIVKVPLKFTGDNTNLYKAAAVEAVRSLSSVSSTTSDVSQAALKLISVILRDRIDVKIKEASIEDLLGRLRDDLTDPAHRHVTFNFLRAILDSKMETAAIYDIFDFVGTVMVTNDDKDTRDLARGAYFQFLREYPQKKNRWSKQLAFIVANLKYEREGGRLSILEVVHLLLSKSSNDFVQEVSATCFVPLIFVLINDDSESCRTAAGEVIKEIFRKADRQRMQTFLELQRSWINQQKNTSVMRLGFLSHEFYYEACSQDDTGVDILLDSILEVLRRAKTTQSDWELIYAALQLSVTLSRIFPNRILSSKAVELWVALRPCLSYPHAWVKLSAARLLTIYSTDFANSNTNSDSLSLPLKGSRGLRLEADEVKELIKVLAGMFNTPCLTDTLAQEIVRSITFLGQCAGVADLKWKSMHEEENASDDEDEVVEDNEEQDTALSYLFRRLSFILRREIFPPRFSSLIPKTAALQAIEILCKNLSAEILLPALQIILLPLHNFTDPNIPIPYSTDKLFKTSYEALEANSQEIMFLLQKKLGTANYTAQLLKVIEGVKMRRGARSSKRKIEAVAAPEMFERNKKKKVERKKERRKEKGMENRDMRRGW